MHEDLIRFLIEARLLVGFAGEQNPTRWWPGAFLDKDSIAFLSPLFPRTSVLAQFKGICCEASRIHDERIGVGGAYHLFRLPNDIEQRIHSAIMMRGAVVATPEGTLDSVERCVNRLVQMAGISVASKEGPVRIGAKDDIASLDKWCLCTAHYAHALRNGNPVFPFLAGKK